ncbi:hypothetical protein H9Q13_00190 [Pontibacter sp. JH31]|uniref:Lipoprotein n=1 Tax=Pontibacter aquaedesilientis TaxID=2766980 RepID=A0ABR7XBB8_9BACT|nr:hypothetical protein [Pontibacter aquaedesilientis]MBD1395570.1 hypothetical protein [Pontibacter aquaedesilientis]
MKQIFTTTTLVLFAILLFFSSCNDCSVSVAQFENGDSNWTVYNSGDTLHLVDEKNTVFRFVNTRITSDPVPGEGFSPTDACIEQYDTRRASVMQETTNPKRLPGLSVVALKKPSVIQVSLVVVNRGELPIPDLNTPQHASLQVNGFTYQNVFDLVSNDSIPDGVRRILFNREYGFLQVEYFRGVTTHGRVLKRVP